MYDATPVLEYLDRKGILYTVDRHPKTATAQETAEVEHVSGKHFAKTVVLRSDHEILLAVVPAHLRVGLAKLARVHGRGPLRLASEEDFVDTFPNCEVGAMPPFGKLYSQPSSPTDEPLTVYIDDDIATAPRVTFNAGSHEHTLTVAGQDFLKAAEGIVADISE